MNDVDEDDVERSVWLSGGLMKLLVCEIDEKSTAVGFDQNNIKVAAKHSKLLNKESKTEEMGSSQIGRNHFHPIL